MTSALVIGPGAIGTFFAVHLIGGGRVDVAVASRRPLPELVLASDGEEQRVTPMVFTDPASVETPFDWVLLATKAHQTAAASGWLQAACGPDTTVVVLQNGVEHEARVAPFVGSATVVPAVVYCGAEVVAPGRVVHRSNGFLIAPEGDRGRALAELYEGTGAGIRLTRDFGSAQWKKLVSNVVANGITALTGRRMEVMRTPAVAELGRAVVREGIVVARAEGADIDDGYADLLIEGIGAMPDDSGTSMLYDRLAGRPLEYDALYGAVLRAAARHDIAVPRTETLFALLQGLSDGLGSRGALEPVDGAGRRS